MRAISRTFPIERDGTHWQPGIKSCWSVYRPRDNLSAKPLTKELDATTIVSVGHRPELEAFDNRKITLERRRGGAKFVPTYDCDAAD
jgi:hypothetical protein